MEHTWDGQKDEGQQPRPRGMVDLHMSTGLARNAYAALAKLMGPSYPSALSGMRRQHFGELSNAEQEGVWKLAEQLRDATRGV